MHLQLRLRLQGALRKRDMRLRGVHHGLAVLRLQEMFGQFVRVVRVRAVRMLLLAGHSEQFGRSGHLSRTAAATLINAAACMHRSPVV